MKFINRFCMKHPNFGVRNIMLYITIGNVAFWILSMIAPGMMRYFTFAPERILHGEIWRLFTFIIYPPTTDWLAFIAFYFYYWIGSTLERYWGTGEFNCYLLIGWGLIVLYGFLVYIITGVGYTYGGECIEYLFLSLFFSFASLFPDTRVLLFFVIPIKMKWLALVDAIFFVAAVINYPFPWRLVPLIAVVNYLIFFMPDILRMIRGTKTSATTVNFRKESEKIRREQRAELYKHKCCVCGRTDTDYPNLEFRYCSRCAGYRCFCADHINNHVHFTE